MLISVADHRDGTVTVSFMTATYNVSALDVPTDIALRALAALTQGRADDEFPFHLAGDSDSLSLIIRQGKFRNISTVSVEAEPTVREAAKALARVAFILTDTDTTEGE